MAKITPISGFPEWSPEERMVEQRIMRMLEQRFELHGFVPIETRAIEPLDVLLSKGDDKEIYVIKRLHADPGAEEEKAGLHFDLTVPFARYAVEYQHKLHFPFKRYQMQKVWRGERKQEGRYREFYQCDIDIIGQGSLPLAYDIELPRLLCELLGDLPIPKVMLKLNNRKILEGVYRGLGVESKIDAVLRIVDKLAKIGPEAVLEQLVSDVGLSSAAAETCLALGRITAKDGTFVDAVKALGVDHPLLTEGLVELEQVLEKCLLTAPDQVEVDLSIARGLSYYTGTVYEGYLQGHEHIGAVCSGGRYDNLAEGGRQAMPGVGVSIGITRLLGYLFGKGLLKPAKLSPVEVMVILPDEGSREEAYQKAQQLRLRGISADVYHQPQNFGKQMKAAQKRGIRYVLFLGDVLQIKDLQTGEQGAINLGEWFPEVSIPPFNLDA